MPAQSGDNVNDGGFSLGQPKCTLTLSFSCLQALFLAIVGLGKGSAQFTHQLLKALVAHWRMGTGVFSLGDFAVEVVLICEWHRGGREKAQVTTWVSEALVVLKS